MAKVFWSDIEKIEICESIFADLKISNLGLMPHRSGLAKLINEHQKVLGIERQRPINSIYKNVNEMFDILMEVKNKSSERQEIHGKAKEDTDSILDLIDQRIKVNDSIEDIIRRVVREEIEDLFKMYIGKISETRPSTNPIQRLVSEQKEEREVKLKVDIVGLIGSQKEIVSRSVVASKFKLRFIGVDGSKDYGSDIVVLCTKFINHVCQTQYKNRKANIYYANGGPTSVIDALADVYRENCEKATVDKVN